MAKIDPAAGAAALNQWVGAAEPAAVSRQAAVTAVRFSLAELARRIPGRAVEVRVPPAGAVQVLGGTTHRRGTPPAVVEMEIPVWLDLATGQLTWEQAEARGLLDASGERADLSPYLPLL